MPAPEIIKLLVENFGENRDGYHSGKYNEAQLWQEFLNPSFATLGKNATIEEWNARHVIFMDDSGYIGRGEFTR
jgi:hypothetical protein